MFSRALFLPISSLMFIQLFYKIPLFILTVIFLQSLRNPAAFPLAYVIGPLVLILDITFICISTLIPNHHPPTSSSPSSWPLDLAVICHFWSLHLLSSQQLGTNTHTQTARDHVCVRVCVV